MTPVTDPRILEQLNAPQPISSAAPGRVTDARVLAQLNNAAVEEDEFTKRIRAELKESGGYLANLGAGANAVLQGAKQLFGRGTESDEEILERRKIDEKLAEGRFGGGLVQTVGEIAAQAPLSLATGGVGTVLTKLPMMARAAGMGGKVANIGNVARGVVEGAVGGSLASVTSDESRASNALLGGTIGAALPLAVGATGKAWRTLSPTEKATAYRAQRQLEKELGKGGTKAVTETLDTPAVQAIRLPLSTAALSGSPTLGRLERGARARNSGPDDIVYNRDKAVADEAWNWMTEATKLGDELPGMRAEHEEVLKKLREDILGHHNTKFDAQKFEDAQQSVLDDIQRMREHPSGRVLGNRDVQRGLGEIEAVATNPAATPLHFDTAADMAKNLARDIEGDPNLTGMVRELEQRIRDAGDTVSKNRVSELKLQQMSGADLLKQAESAANVRGAFISGQGVPTTPHPFGDAPRLDERGVRKALVTHGEEKVGDQSYPTLAPDDWASVKQLADELRKAELYKVKESPGATSIDADNPLSIPFSGVNNPLNQQWGLKGLVNYITGGSMSKTAKEVDRAVINPDDWHRLMETVKVLRERDPEKFFGKTLPNLSADVQKYLIRLPGTAAASELGD